MSGRYYRTMMFMIEGSTAKIDQTYFGIANTMDVFFLKKKKKLITIDVFVLVES